MPIDPSIIGNIMAPQTVQMPDVNAMMQTQTRGMENIYQIEAAREAQAKEAAKAQEDAAIKALLPAYAHALKTGDLRGALKLAPPQYQDSLVPYIDALEGKPIEEIQAALTGSLVTSEVGRAFLENQSRVATLGVQQGQLDVSREDIKLRRQKQEAEAKSGSKIVQWIGNDAGDQTGLDAQGNIVVTVPGIGKKTAQPVGVKANTEEAKFKVDETLSELLSSYNKLKKGDAIVSTQDSTLGNIAARTGAALGTTVGRAVGTSAQTERDYIQNLRTDLIRDIKLATGMSSQELNSNFELQAALDALGDPYSQSFETAVRTIEKLSRKYGLGNIKAPPIGGEDGGEDGGDEGTVDENNPLLSGTK